MRRSEKNKLAAGGFVAVALILVIVVIIRGNRTPETVVPVEPRRDTPATDNRARDRERPQANAPDRPRPAATPAPPPLDPAQLEQYLCRHRVQIQGAENVEPGQLEFALLHRNDELRTREQVAAWSTALVGNAPDAAADGVAAAIRDAWPPVAGPDGTFGIVLGQNVKAQLLVRAPGGRQGTAMLFRCSNEMHQILLQETWDLAGRVIIRGTGAASPGYRVRLEGPGIQKAAVADASGSFRFDGLPRGEMLFVIPDETSRPGFLPEVSPIMIPPDQAGQPVEIGLVPADELKVRVTNEAGEPVAGAQVTVLPKDLVDSGILISAPGAVAYSATKEDGTAVLKTEVGAESILRVRHGNYEDWQGEVKLASGATQEVVLRSHRSIRVRFVDFRSGQEFPGTVMVYMPKSFLSEYPAGTAMKGGADEVSIAARGELTLKLARSGEPLTIRATDTESTLAGEVTFSTVEIDAASRNNEPLVVPLREELEMILIVRDLQGQVPEGYAVEVSLPGGVKRRYEAAAMRTDRFDPQTPSEALKMPVAPVFPMKIRVVGSSNFIGEASFANAQEFYEVTASRSQFVIVTLDAPGYGEDQRLGRRTDPSLYIDSVDAVYPMPGGVYQGYLPFGASTLTVTWMDSDSGETKTATKAVTVEESKEPLRIFVGGSGDE